MTHHKTFYDVGRYRVSGTFLDWVIFRVMGHFVMDPSVMGRFVCELNELPLNCLKNCFKMLGLLMLYNDDLCCY
jgi:hypothetical protein